MVPPVKVQASAIVVTNWSTFRRSNLAVATAAPSVPYTGLDLNPRAWVEGMKSPAILASTHTRRQGGYQFPTSPPLIWAVARAAGIMHGPG